MQDGKSLGIIGSHLGHKDAASKARYSHLSGEESLETGAANLFKILNACSINFLSFYFHFFFLLYI